MKTTTSLASGLLSLLLAAALLTLAPSAAHAKKKKDADAAAEKKDEKSWEVNNPPGDWRTISLDTEETTWSNLDVSPDGATIVFDMLGDLYTVPIGGGEATALTSEIAWNMQPRFSPDGSEIAYISDREGGDALWVMRADGSEPRKVSDDDASLVHNPYWSPDGQYIAGKKGYMSGRSIPAGEIWMFHSGGGGGLQLVERSHGPESQKNIAEPAFSHDGRYLYYSQDTTPGVRWEYNKDPTGSIFAIQRLDLDTGETERFVSGAGGAIRPVPSPNGKLLAFVKRLPTGLSALYVKDLASGVEHAVYSALDRDLQETNGSHGNTPAFDWMPDSKSLVFWAAGKIHRVDLASKEASTIPVHVKAEKKVRQALRFPVEVAPERFRVKMLRWAQYGPQGDFTVFEALGRLWIQEIEEGDVSGEPRPLTGGENGFESYPAISPDGGRIAYVTWDDDKLGHLRVIGRDGTGERVLTPKGGIYLEPSWSADGGHVAFRKATGGYLLSAENSVDPGLYVVATDGEAKPKRVTESGAYPGFLPGERFDGETRLRFLDYADDNNLQLKSVDLEGRDERVHAQGDMLTEISVSPDGRWVAFLADWNAYVTPLPRMGKAISLSAGATAIPVKQVSKRSGEFFHWSADSSTLHWSQGAMLFSRDLKDAFAFLEGAPEELPEPASTGLDLAFDTDTAIARGEIALVGARIVTMRGADSAQEVIEDGAVVVRDGRIVAVGPRGEVEIPSGAEVVDVAGKTIIPGMVDVHAHGGMGSLEIIPQQNWMQLSNLSFGVTTIHDPSNDSSEIFSAAELQRAGKIVAPRIYSTGTILYGATGPGYTATIKNYDDALFHVRRLKDLGAISVKSYNQPRRAQRQQVIAAGAELHMMVVPEGGAKFQHNMNMIVDGHTGVEHAIPIAMGYDDVRQFWSQTEVGYTPTFGVAYGGLSGETYWYDRTEVWKDERLMSFVPRRMVEPGAIRRSTAPDEHYNHFQVAKFAKSLRDAGVSVQIGAHGQREGLAAHWELWMLEQGGMTPWEAFRAATIDGARYVGLDGDIGSLEVGKLADLVVIDGNPLEDLKRSEDVTHTMLGGRLYDAATMNEVWPEQVERGELFFRKEGGDTIHPATQEWMEEFAHRHGWVH